MIIRSLALGLCLLAAACDKKADEASNSAAGGEVLPGTISDAMIDLDTSTASPPLAAVHAEKKTATPEASEAAADEVVAEPAAAAPAAPADSADTQ